MKRGPAGDAAGGVGGRGEQPPGGRAAPDRGEHQDREQRPGQQAGPGGHPRAPAGVPQHRQCPDGDGGELPGGEAEEEPDPGLGVVGVDVAHECVPPAVQTGTTGIAAAAPPAPAAAPAPPPAPAAAAGAGGAPGAPGATGGVGLGVLPSAPVSPRTSGALLVGWSLAAAA